MSSFPAVGQQPTPILDLLEDAPRSNPRSSLWGFFRAFAISLVICLGIAVLMTIFAEADNVRFETGVLSPALGFGLLNPIAFFATLFSTLLIAITLHELGHLFAGKSAGLAMVGMQIGPIALDRSS